MRETKSIIMTRMMKNFLIATTLVAIVQFTSAALTNNEKTSFGPSSAGKPVRGVFAGLVNENNGNSLPNDRVQAPTIGPVSGPETNSNQLVAESFDNFHPQTNNSPTTTVNNLNTNDHSLAAKSSQEIDDDIVLSRLDLAHLSKIRMETKQATLERKCTIYDEELRKMLAEKGAISSRALLAQVVRVLSQRKLPFGNSQPALADLKECLESSQWNRAEDSVRSEATVRREVIAGPNTARKFDGSSQRATSGDKLQDAIGEFKGVRNNVKDFGQDIYSPSNRNLLGQNSFSPNNQKASVYGGGGGNPLKRPVDSVSMEGKQLSQEGASNLNNNHLDGHHLPPIKVRKVETNRRVAPFDDELHLNPGYEPNNQVGHELKIDNDKILERIDISHLLQVGRRTSQMIPVTKCVVLGDELRAMTGLTSPNKELFSLVSTLMSKSISPEALPVLTAVNVCLKSSKDDENKGLTKHPYQMSSDAFPKPGTNVYNNQYDMQANFNHDGSPLNKYGNQVDEDDDDPPNMIVYQSYPERDVEQEYQQNQLYDEGEAHSAENHVENYQDNFSYDPLEHSVNHNGHPFDDQYKSYREVGDVSKPEASNIVEKELEIRDLKHQVSQLQDLVEQAHEEAFKSKEELNRLNRDILNRQSDDDMKNNLLRTHHEEASSREQALLNQLEELKEKLKRQDEVIKRNFELEDEVEDDLEDKNGKDLKGDKSNKDKDNLKKEFKNIIESASELKGKIDKNESLFDRCYRYYLLLSYPKKVNKYVVKTIANLDINLEAGKTALYGLIEPSSLDSILKSAEKLVNSSKRKAVEVGNELYSCFGNYRNVGLRTLVEPKVNHQSSNKGKSFFDSYYSESSSREGSRPVKSIEIPIHRVHRAIPPIPPMPPMMSVSQNFGSFS